MRREDWDRRYAEKPQLWSDEPYRHLLAEVADLLPGRALDLACGDGRHAIPLAELGWSVTGVDFSEVAIARARRRARAARVDVDFRAHDLLEFHPEPEAFGLVLVMFLQLPAAERRSVLSRAVGALSPGGMLLLVGHDLLNLTEGVGGPSDPDVLYTPEDIVSELPGLEIEKAERVYRDVAGADRPAIDVLVRMRKPAVGERGSQARERP